MNIQAEVQCLLLGLLDTVTNIHTTQIWQRSWKTLKLNIILIVVAFKHFPPHSMSPSPEIVGSKSDRVANWSPYIMLFSGARRIFSGICTQSNVL